MAAGQMGLAQNHLNPFGNRQTHLNPFGKHKTHLNPFGNPETHLDFGFQYSVRMDSCIFAALFNYATVHTNKGEKNKGE